MADREPRICIVGAGLSGLLMGIRLKQAGINSFQILEKADTLGGTWRANRYPGVACDVASVYYCYSFEPNPEWSHRFAPGAEIWSYLDGVADKYGLRPHLRFNTSVEAIRWNGSQWEIDLGGELQSADVVVMACGYLNHPRYPDIDELHSFKGALFHSADWDETADLTGKRVGLIGTGSSGTQMAGPVADVAAKLSVFQRTAHWVLPTAFVRPGRSNPRYTRPRRTIARRFPIYNRLVRGTWGLLYSQFADAVVIDNWKRHTIDWLCRRYISIAVKDPDLRRRLTPDYDVLCKRLVFASSYYATLQQPHVELVSERIDHVEPTGIVTRDGTRHELDVIILATGFHAHDFGIPRIENEQGRTLQEAWANGTRAYRTIGYPDFPNLFHVVGPNSPVGNTSIVDVAETQTNYILACIELIRRGEASTLVPSLASTERFNRAVDSASTSTVWMTGCKSWYLASDGTLMSWPWTVQQFHDELRTPDLADWQAS